MKKERYKKIQKHTEGHFVRCCAIENKDRVYLGLENGGDAEGLSIAYYYAKTETKWGVKGRAGYYRANCAIVPAENNSFVLAGWKGDVFAQHGFKQSTAFPTSTIPNLIEEQPIPLLSNCPLASMRIIDGQAYVAGAWRTVFRREGVENWTCLHGNNAKEVERLQKAESIVGFSDIGGFAKDDIYACGAAGDLCHYDGQTWKQLDAPTNKDMVCMCCTPKGEVYIACEDGTLIKGRDSRWEILKEKVSNDVQDMIWYQEKLYIACGMHGLYQYDEQKVVSTKGVSSFGEVIGQEETLTEGTKQALKSNGMNKEDIDIVNALSSVKMSSDILLSPRKLATDGEILLVSDNNRVVAFNGDEWKVLFVTYPSENGGALW